MKNIKYYQDQKHGFLLAYEKSVEFFVMYLPDKKEWADCNISFANFKHDYEFKEMSEEEVLGKTNGNLPESMYQKYADMLRKMADAQTEKSPE